jgi:hypothetical protein
VEEVIPLAAAQINLVACASQSCCLRKAMFAETAQSGFLIEVAEGRESPINEGICREKSVIDFGILLTTLRGCFEHRGQFILVPPISAHQTPD